MKRIVVAISILVILLSIFCCSNEPNTNYKNVQNIKWDSLNNIDILSNKNTHIKYIKLESGENCLLRDINKIESDDSILFIEDYMQRIYIFNIQGKYITQIGKKGGAQNEYTELWDFVVDKNKDIIYLYDLNKMSILRYDYNGNYLGRKKIDSFKLANAYKIAFADSSHIITVNFNNPESTCNFSLFDINSQTSKDYISYISVGKENSANGTGRISNYKKNLLLCPELSDTIYKFDNGLFLPFYVFQAPYKHATKDDINQEFEVGFSAESYLLKKSISAGIRNLYSTDNIIYFTYLTNDAYYMIFYNTRNKIGYKFNMKKCSAEILPIWNNLIATTKNAFICTIPILDFKNCEELQNSNPNLYNLLKESKDSDNPILAFIYVDE